MELKSKLVTAFSAIAMLFVPACSNGNEEKSRPSVEGSAPRSLPTLALSVWYDARFDNRSELIDFESMQYALGSKGSDELLAGFGGAIENCSTDELHCFFAGRPYSIPKSKAVKRWSIDEFECDLSGSEARGKITCISTMPDSPSSIRSFELLLVNGCISEDKAIISGFEDTDHHFEAREKGVCIEVIRKFL